MEIRLLEDRKKINEIVEIHLLSFQGFFLTFLGRGFLKNLYEHFLYHSDSGIIVAIENERIIGFLAFSNDISNFYKTLLKKRFFELGWYSFLATLRKPKVMFRLLRAFTYSKKSERKEKYIELSSIGVLPNQERRNIGSKLIDKLKEIFESSDCKYIKLETDAIDNEKANNFYIKNGFTLQGSYKTPEGREMNEYLYKKVGK